MQGHRLEQHRRDLSEQALSAKQVMANAFEELR